MSGLSALLALALSFAVACVQNRQPPPQPSNLAPAPERVTETVSAKLETATQGRDLTLYDFGGRRGCKTPFIRHSRQCGRSLQRARHFIWKHWQEKERGYIIVKRASVDAASDAHVFIEPDDRGAWQIVWREELIYAASVPYAIPGTVSELAEIRFIKRRRALDTEDLRPSTLCLVFLDKSGEQVESL